MNVWKKYTRSVLIGAGLLVFFVSAFNVLVDPYAIFGTQRLVGLNELKPFAGDRGRIGKLYQVLRAAPNSLIVGNSRPEMGLSPEHPCWPTIAQPVYNIALPGLSVYNQVRYAQHAQATGPAQVLLIGVDFVDFLSAAPPPEPTRWPPSLTEIGTETFAIDPFGRPNENFFWVRAKDYVSASMSLDALGHSLVTLAKQRTEDTPTRTNAGFNTAEAMFRPIVLTEGPRVLFDQKNQELANRLNGKVWHLFSKGVDWSPDFEALRRLIRQSRGAGTKTVLFINPYHAEYLLLMHTAQLWPKFEAWKRRLAQLARSENVPLWDFSGFDAYSTEEVDALPPRGTSLEWYWEPAHYRRELGDLMLANILRNDCPSDQGQQPHYGVRLDGEDGKAKVNIDAHFAAQRQSRDRYITNHSDLISRIEKLFAE